MACQEINPLSDPAGRPVAIGSGSIDIIIIINIIDIMAIIAMLKPYLSHLPNTHPSQSGTCMAHMAVYSLQLAACSFLLPSS